MAHTIKTETKVGGNTADRVGSAFEGVADALEGTEQIAEMDKAVQEVQQQVDASKAQIQSLVNALPVVQQTGDSTTSVMSQNAVTDAIQEETDRATAAEQAIIYDVSSHNNGAVFESLQALLSSSNLNTLIPPSVRHGGMIIQFIQGSGQGSDNKYVQYRLMSDSFNTTPTNWQGVDDEPTSGSDNLVKSGGTKSYADGKAIEIYTFLKDIHPNFYKDSFIIADLDGNVAFEVDKRGNTKYVGKVTDVFSNYNENKFIIADKNGYIVAKFEDKGATIAFKDPTNFLERKVFYTLGDSLSAANKYQLKLAEITGATFDAEANIDTVKPISVGGTTTMGANNTSGFQRARNLVSLAGNKDVVIIENINDMNHVSYGGDINSAPYTEYPDGTNNGATKTLYGAYKWLCEYLITNLPSTKLFWMIPNRIAINYSSPETRPDGTINMDYYTSTQAHKQYMQLVTIQKEVAAYYGIPVLDMIEESGMNYINGGTFFNDNNVHPKDVGYYRWGETIARLLTSK